MERKENNVTYELLIFVLEVVKKAVDGNNLVKKNIPGFVISYIFDALALAIDNVKKSNVKKLAPLQKISLI